MAMREPVAMDFMGVGPAAAGRNGSRRSPEVAAVWESGRLPVRPIPNGAHTRKSPEDGGGSISNHAFSSPGNKLHGLRKQPWSRRFQTEEGHGVVSAKRERASPDAAPAVQVHHLSDNSTPASPSHQNQGEFWRMQQPQAGKSQTMYAGHQQAGAPRTSPFRDETSQRGARADPEHQPLPPSSKGVFGSPTPFHFQANGAEALANERLSPKFHNYPFQAGNVQGQAVARPASGGGKQQQPPPTTTQLTIFYAGMVNVYNDVPFDKARVIMLLAGSGNSWSSNYMNPPVTGGAAAGRNPFLKTPMSVPQSTPSTPGSPVASPQVPTTGGHPPRSGVIFSNVRQAPITNVELPQARKASLARFLEKRKDRSRKPSLSEDVESASASRDKSPGPSTSQPSTRSPSPFPAVQDQHHRASRAPSVQPRRDQGSEPNSPPTKAPNTPPRQNALDCEKKAPSTPKRRDNSDQADFNKRARSGRSHDPGESSGSL